MPWAQHGSMTSSRTPRSRLQIDLQCIMWAPSWYQQETSESWHHHAQFSHWIVTQANPILVRDSRTRPARDCCARCAQDNAVLPVLFCLYNSSSTSDPFSHASMPLPLGPIIFQSHAEFPIILITFLFFSFIIFILINQHTF